MGLFFLWGLMAFLWDFINKCTSVADISTDKLNQETSKLSSETYEKIHGNQKLQCQWRPGKFARTKKLNSVKNLFILVQILQS